MTTQTMFSSELTCCTTSFPQTRFTMSSPVHHHWNGAGCWCWSRDIFNLNDSRVAATLRRRLSNISVNCYSFFEYLRCVDIDDEHF